MLTLRLVLNQKVVVSQLLVTASHINIKKYKPSGFCYQIVCFDDKLYLQDPVIYRAKREDNDVAQIFVEMLEENNKNIHKDSA